MNYLTLVYRSHTHVYFYRLTSTVSLPVVLLCRLVRHFVSSTIVDECCKNDMQEKKLMVKMKMIAMRFHFTPCQPNEEQ